MQIDSLWMEITRRKMRTRTRNRTRKMRTRKMRTRKMRTGKKRTRTKRKSFLRLFFANRQPVDGNDKEQGEDEDD